PNANVLVMTLELCSLHMQIDESHDCILANSLFADGVAAALVSSKKPHPSEVHAASLEHFHTTTIPSGIDDMAWYIGDQGFDLKLSNYVPQVIESGIEPIIKDIDDPETVDHWAVHPGGRSILDKVQDSMGLDPAALDIPREVLRTHGNMSAATIMFVLKEMLPQAKAGEKTMAVAFGPGLTVEGGILVSV
ncbi:MAG: 3-oxoacyl-[acyl-carrier-protein] synthase III C-terminal domain-containing protein, partial [Verrucomicrobiota bacterium]